MKNTIILIAIIFIFSYHSESKADNSFFENNIRPILVDKCYSCHSSTMQEPKGGLSLDYKDGLLKGGDSGQAIVPHKSHESLLIKAIAHEDLQMPPNEKLSDAIIGNFKKWIDSGAIDPRDKPSSSLDLKNTMWALQPINQTNNSSIDIIVANKRKEIGINTEYVLADDYTLIRRLYLDIVGIQPSVDEILLYINDNSSDKYTKLVDKLLNDKRFGEKWARHWLDISRYGESTGKDQNILYPYAWRYRDYVIESFNTNKPYNLFIKEQIAGDLLKANNSNERNNNLLATGFLTIGTKSLNTGPKEYQAENIDDQIDVISRGFLGITLSCARCHDHKFDPFTQKDYYSLYTILSNTKIKDGVYRGNNNIGYEGDYEYLIDNHLMFYYQNNQLDIIDLFGSINNHFQRLKTIHIYNPNLNENDKKQAVAEAEKVTKELDELIKKLPDTEDARILLLKIFTDSPLSPIMATRENPTIVDKTKIHIRGNVNSLGEETIKNIPLIFHNDIIENNPSISKDSGRLELANWIADKNNSLTHRVLVNRIWNYLFGSGIVESFDNFGNLGGQPKNAELLDYLSSKFIESNFNIKNLIKDIVCSSVYKQSTDFNKDNYDIDSDNTYLWRMNRKHLTSDSIRDNLLFISNQLTDSKTDHNKIMSGNTKRRINGEINKEIVNAKYRSIYLPCPRDYSIESLDIFNRPDNNLLNANRDETIVATQALYMMNNSSINSYCELMAKEINEKLKDKSTKEKIVYGYLKCLSRVPSEQEITIFENYFLKSDNNTNALIGLIQTLISTLAFRSIP